MITERCFVNPMNSMPIYSMYVIFRANVGKYSIHGAYGIVLGFIIIGFFIVMLISMKVIHKLYYN